jgi:hypothetical protein
VKLTQGQEPSRQHNTNDVYKKIIEIFSTTTFQNALKLMI